MRTLPLSLLVLSLVAAEDTPKPKFPVGKDTTFATGPLDKEGYIDYEAALNDRLGKGITPEKNANVLIWKALGPKPEGGKGMPAAYFKRLGIDEPPKDGNYFVGLRPYLHDQLKLDADERTFIDEQQFYRAYQRPWTAKLYPKVSDWLKANEKPLALIVEAVKCQEYYNPLIVRRNEKGAGSLINALLPSVQKCRELGNVLTARAMLRIGEGKFDDAWQDLLACHRLARLVARGGTSIEALVGIAIEAITCDADLVYLEHAKLNAGQIKERLKQLHGLPPMSPLADKVDLAERFVYLETIQIIRRYGPSAMENLAAEPAKEPNAAERAALDKIDWEPALRSGNRWYDRMAAALRLKDRAERTKELNKLSGELDARVKKARQSSGLSSFLPWKTRPDKEVGKAIGDIMIGLLVPAFRRVADAYDRTEQIQRNLHIALALAAYHADKGRYPAKLDELAPKYLAAVPRDLFSGEVLVYHPAENGYLLYSVGVNGEDEGGRWTDDTPPGDDPRVRMPLPELKLLRN